MSAFLFFIGRCWRDHLHPDWLSLVTTNVGVIKAQPHNAIKEKPLLLLLLITSLFHYHIMLITTLSRRLIASSLRAKAVPSVPRAVSMAARWQSTSVTVCSFLVVLLFIIDVPACAQFLLLTCSIAFAVFGWTSDGRFVGIES